MHGPTTTPCGECDICQGIASRRAMSTCSKSTAPATAASTKFASCGRTSTSAPAGRASRSTSSTKFTCSRRQAFNALLKTLEEPPEHVKFIFCTTEADKIPITVLSRCQRFDFAPIETQSIVERLAADLPKRRGRGRARSAADPRPPGGRFDARQPVAARATALVRRREDHRRRCASPARHGPSGAAGSAGRVHRSLATPPRPCAKLDAAVARRGRCRAIRRATARLLPRLLAAHRRLLGRICCCTPSPSD